MGLGLKTSQFGFKVPVLVAVIRNAVLVGRKKTA